MFNFERGNHGLRPCVCPSVPPSVHPSLCLSIRPPSVHPSICLSVPPSVPQSVYPSLSVPPSVYLSPLGLSVPPSVHPYICLSVPPSVCLSIPVCPSVPPLSLYPSPLCPHPPASRRLSAGRRVVSKPRCILVKQIVQLLVSLCFPGEYQREEVEPSASGSFMTLFVVATVIVVLAYLVYHNKKKVSHIVAPCSGRALRGQQLFWVFGTSGQVPPHCGETTLVVFAIGHFPL